MVNFPRFSTFLPIAVAALAAHLTSATIWAQGDTYKPGAPKGKDKVPQDLRKEGESLFGGGGGGKEKPSGAAGSWTIVIVAFRGEGAAANAREGLAKVRSQTGLDGAFIEERGPAQVIAYGHYADPSAKEAQADLDKVRSIEVMFEGRPARVFADAMLAPPAGIAGSRPEWDLRGAKKLNGDWALYTLQIGVYSREDRKPASASDLAEFRKMAEQAVATLRREGELAFYYHGPNRSMVTIGLWGQEDFDEVGKLDLNPALAAARKRFPHNLQNGMGIRQRITATDPKTGQQVKTDRIQPSALVGVPND